MSRAGRAPFHPCPVQKLGALASRYFVEPPPPGLPLGPVGPARAFVAGRAEAWAVLFAARCARASVAKRLRAASSGVLCYPGPFLRFTQGRQNRFWTNSGQAKRAPETPLSAALPWLLFGVHCPGGCQTRIGPKNCTAAPWARQTTRQRQHLKTAAAQNCRTRRATASFPRDAATQPRSALRGQKRAPAARKIKHCASGSTDRRRVTAEDGGGGAMDDSSTSSTTRRS